ncbi:hypothetical protein COP2_028196 [Malus domestica]
MSIVETTAAAHDTTGGMMTKISEAEAIAKLGINVYIVKAETTHIVRALSGELKGNIPKQQSSFRMKDRSLCSGCRFQVSRILIELTKVNDFGENRHQPMIIVLKISA